jgi:Protein of unknown function (DUF551)
MDPSAASDWRLIDTGPKDGTYVLLYFAGADPAVRVGRWMPEVYGWPGHWFSYSSILKRRGEPGPSHWMPLPGPPSQFRP